MATLPRPSLNRIPAVAPTIKQDNAVKDLAKLSRLELLDLKERQSKLLANKANLKRLPDKGKRIVDFYDKVILELKRRTNIDEAANMFSMLNIASKGKDVLNSLEWNGRLKDCETDDPTEDVLDSDDEAELNPLQVIAQRTMHERRTKVLPLEPKLITEEDLAEIESFKNATEGEVYNAKLTNGVIVEKDNAASNVVDVQVVEIDVSEKLPNIQTKIQHILQKSSSSKTNSKSGDSRCSTPAQTDIDQHVRYLVTKTELNVEPQREKYKPYQTTMTDVHDPAKERIRKKGKHWEVTAATPPLIKHSGAKMLKLLDSVELQTNYLTKMKNLQEKQAEERLAARNARLEQRNMKLPTDDELKTNASFTVYRTPAVHIEGERELNEDEEVHDPLDEEKVVGGVTYTIYK
ncbi:DNA-directed RNA polymerase II subunit GRINL1A [Eurosta solidaginis]|uniref:DNA-directed RNA polymerase II subunit GRINL1A n=1 Tax=Eurosta solidaginis TaxID=178769 RepID=UPI0035317482